MKTNQEKFQRDFIEIFILYPFGRFLSAEPKSVSKCPLNNFQKLEIIENDIRSKKITLLPNNEIVVNVINWLNSLDIKDYEIVPRYLKKIFETFSLEEDSRAEIIKMWIKNKVPLESIQDVEYKGDYLRELFEMVSDSNKLKIIDSIFIEENNMENKCISTEQDPEFKNINPSKYINFSTDQSKML